MSSFAQSRLVDGYLVTWEAVFLQPGGSWAEGITITSPDGTTITPDDRRDGVAITVFYPRTLPPRPTATAGKPRRSTAYVRGATHLFARPDVTVDGLVTRGWLESAEGEAWLTARSRDVLGPQRAEGEFPRPAPDPATHLLPGLYTSPKTGPFAAAVDDVIRRVGLIDLPLVSRETGIGHPSARLDPTTLQPLAAEEPTPWVRAAEAATQGDDRRPTLDRFAGCLLGLAIGDAFGLTRRHLSLEAIRRMFPGEALTDFAAVPGGPHPCSAHTQLALFTAEGLIRADVRSRERGIGADTAGVVYHAYLRWLALQGRPVAHDFFKPERMDGWLRLVPGLAQVRHPGETTLNTLASGQRGSVDRPISTSDGCGAIPRVAPVACVFGHQPERAFETARDIAALTHGGFDGNHAPAGFAVLLGALVNGSSLDAAVRALTTQYAPAFGQGQWSHNLIGAWEAAERESATPEAVQALGQGYLARDALAMAVFCARQATSFAHGMALAVNHGGDSDAVGAIAGALLGAIHGKRGIPPAWLNALAGRGVVEEMARDLFAYFGGIDAPWTRNDWERYPGW